MKYFACAAAAALSVIAPSVSHATTFNLSNWGFAVGSKDGTLHTVGGPFNNATTNFGQFNLTGTVTPGGAPVSLYTYCVDLGHSLIIPGVFDVASVTTRFSAATALNMTKLLANVTPINADMSAAVQLAMWELAFDTSASKDVESGGTQGQFYVTAGSSTTARTLANGYLASLGVWSVPTGGTAYLLIDPSDPSGRNANSNQIQIFYAVTAVPEAATWAMMIVGFGVVGASMRRRIKVSYRIV
jgi:PEP-CTERM motif